MKDKVEELKILKERKKELEQIVSKSFTTSEELEEYFQKNKIYFEESDIVTKQIRQLEWYLMTPGQQTRDLEVRRQIRLKTGQIKEGEE